MGSVLHLWAVHNLTLTPTLTLIVLGSVLHLKEVHDYGDQLFLDQPVRPLVPDRVTCPIPPPHYTTSCSWTSLLGLLFLTVDC